MSDMSQADKKSEGFITKKIMVAGYAHFTTKEGIQATIVYDNSGVNDDTAIVFAGLLYLKIGHVYRFHYGILKDMRVIYRMQLLK